MYIQLVKLGIVSVEGCSIWQEAGEGRQSIRIFGASIDLTIPYGEIDWVLLHWWINDGFKFTQDKVMKWTDSPMISTMVFNLPAEFRAWLGLPVAGDDMKAIDRVYGQLLRESIDGIENLDDFFNKYIFNPAIYFESVLSERK